MDELWNGKLSKSCLKSHEFGTKVKIDCVLSYQSTESVPDNLGNIDFVYA